MLIRCSYNNWDTVFGKCKLKNMITLVKTEYIWKMGVATKTIPIACSYGGDLPRPALLSVLPEMSPSFTNWLKKAWKQQPRL